MAEIKPLLDEYGVIFDAQKYLPAELKSDFLEALAELENYDCHKNMSFPKSRLHRFTGIQQGI